MSFQQYRKIFSINRLIGPVLALLALLAVACGGESGESASAGPTPSATLESPTPAATATFVPVEFQGEAVIYVVGPLSGTEAQKGQAQAAGALLAAAQLNRAGGVLQREIIIKELNDRGTAEGARNAAQQVAEAARSGEPVVGVVLYEGSDPDLAAAREILLDSLPALDPLVVVPAATEPQLATVEDPRFFRISAPNLSQARQVAVRFREQNLSQVVVVHSATPYGEALAEEFDRAAGELRVAIQGRFALAPDEVSYASVVEQVRDLNPAGIFFAAGDQEAATFLGDLLGFEFQGTVVGSDRALSYNLLDRLGCQAEGLQFVSVLPEPGAVMTPEQLAAYSNQEGRAPDLFSVAGFSGVQFIVGAYAQGGGLAATAAAGAVRQGVIDTLLGPVSFDASGEVSRPRTRLLQVQSRGLRELLAREVGAGPQLGDQGIGDLSPLLDRTFDPGREPIVFADLDWTSARFHNAIARIIVESGYGFPTQSMYGGAIPLFQNLREGEVDVYLEGWLPNYQSFYDAALAEQQIVDLGRLYGDAAQGWYVPRYVIEGDPARGIEPLAPGLRSVSDLEGLQGRFARPVQPGVGRFLDGSPGWASYQIDCIKLKTYRLDDNYVQVTTGSQAGLFAELDAAYESGEPVLAYLWEPTWPMAKYELQRLEEPPFDQTRWDQDKGVAFPDAQVKKLVGSDLPQRAPGVVEFLRQIALDTDEISEILLDLRESQRTPEDAARDWLRENEAVWSGWVPAEVVPRVREAVQ